MKKPLIVANWKMGLSFAESIRLAEEFGRTLAEQMSQKEIVICPSSIALSDIRRLKIGLKLGAQNVSWELKGKLTGEVSAHDLVSLGCEYCIVGHSSRRQYLGETDKMVHEKTKACLFAGIIPIICIGETWDEKDAGKRDLRIIEQLHSVFKDLVVSDNKRQIIIAYEPIWAIGTGQSIEPTDTFRVADLIRHTLRDFFDQSIIDNQFNILYGGSVSGKTVASFFAHDSINGVLVGSDSLRMDLFKSIVDNI